MSRWKELPTELNAHVGQLVVRLRRLKDHSGLSTRQLAAKTGYSTKSWERYLGGRSLPPRDAVEALARIGDDDPTRLLALHEVAAEAWGDRHGAVTASAPAPAPAPECDTVLSSGPEPERVPGRALRIAVVAGVVTLVLALSSAVLVVVRFSGGEDRTAANPGVSSAAPPEATPSPPGPTYTCRYERLDGHWYAGNSRTQDAILVNGLAGPEIAEAQCLLRRAGLSPGDIDGIYGPRTENAVKRLQKRTDLVVDGIVGPHTWKALRG
ncbi:peptidoglycan-binding protein [Streptomyces sp. NTH33]|uniref:peptidoglycan-binding protein n=1 Tax=Streptomyces sp. NTH33 TaxID=1735453 RepID=UPI000DA89A2A|nr:peptidoglycan-binding protein [Streptomyces sp. NTH33]PZG99989.1 peptidoglycan-binding protein [Streptomyces sp. NTH33]